MTGTVVLIGVFSALAALAVANRRWLMFALLLVGGFPVSMLMPRETFFGFYPGGAYLFVILAVLAIALLFRFPTLLGHSVRSSGFLAFLLYSLLSLLWTPDIGHGLRMLVKLASPFIVLIAMQTFLEDERDLRIAGWMVLACCLAVSALAVINTLGHGILGAGGDDPYFLRKNFLTPPTMSPANYSFLASSGALLALAGWLGSRRPIWLVVFLLLAVCVFWAFTRIAMAGLIVATGVLIFLLSRNMAVKLIFPIVIGIAFFASFFFVDSFRARMFKSEKVEAGMVMTTDLKLLDKLVFTSGRTLIWHRVNEKFFHQAPMAGKGVGSVDAWLERNMNSTRLHSEYLRIASDTGLVGLSLYLLALAQFFAQLIVQYRRNTDPVVRKYSALAMAGLTFYSITLATDNSLNYISEFGLYVYAFLAFAFTAAGVRASRPEPARRNVFTVAPAASGL